MIRIYSLFIILTLCCLSVKSQLSGNAFLSGQSNHSGIKVKFNAHPGTAVTDSAITTSTGSYSINITGGVYDVTFSKPGYLNSNYNNGSATVLTNSVILNNDTLFPGNQIFVNGHVSGNWTSNNTYIVTGDIVVPIGDTLIIQPGTAVKFNGNYSLLDTGLLVAIGNKLNPILFTSNFTNPTPGSWNQISINNSSSVIDNCIIEYCNYGVYFVGCSPTISNSILRNIFYFGMYGYNCAPHIFNNEIYNFLNTNNYAAVGIWVEGPGLVECNHIHNISSTQYHGYGMITGGRSVVKNNIIHDISGPSGNWGIWANADSCWIMNNYIHHAWIGIEAGNSGQTQTPVIINNTITNNNTGITTYGYSCTPYISNNIIVNNNAYGISAGSASCTPSAVTYNLLWNNPGGNYNNVQITGIGQIVGTNSQGNPIDSYYNMSQDPLFVSGIPPVLSSGSPCFSAGNPAYSPNIGFDTSYACIGITNSVNYLSMPDKSIIIFPNPSNGDFRLSSTSILKEVYVLDVTGRLIFKSKPNATTLDISLVTQGVYFVTAITSSGNFTKKVIVYY